MTSNDVLSMYEQLAGLSCQMANAARASDWDSVSMLERQCAAQTAAIDTGVAPLAGDARARKIALLKQIMANDRAVREVSEPWMGQLANVMQSPRADAR